MSVYANSAENAIEESGRRYLGDGDKQLGIDADGTIHHANEERHLVFQFDAHTGALETVTDLDAHPDPQSRHLDTFLAAVETRIGWAHQWTLPTTAIFGGGD